MYERHVAVAVVGFDVKVAVGELVNCCLSDAVAIHHHIQQCACRQVDAAR
jgi:hypothetical protein